MLSTKPVTAATPPPAAAVPLSTDVVPHRRRRLHRSSSRLQPQAPTTTPLPPSPLLTLSAPLTHAVPYEPHDALDADSKRVARPAAFERAIVARTAFDAMVARAPPGLRGGALASLAPLARAYQCPPHRRQTWTQAVPAQHLVSCGSGRRCRPHRPRLCRERLRCPSLPDCRLTMVPARVLCRQFSCACGSCCDDSVIAPLFSKGSGENGVEEAL